jgi:phage shock protein C
MGNFATFSARLRIKLQLKQITIHNGHQDFTGEVITMGPTRKLTRSRTDRQVAGVCGGLAEYFGLDPTVVRVLFIIAGFLTGPGVVMLYIILWAVVPDEY